MPGLRLTGMPEIQPGPARPGEAEARVVQVCVLRKMPVAEIESLSLIPKKQRSQRRRASISTACHELETFARAITSYAAAEH